MKIQITKVHEGAVLPEYQTPGAAAMDLHACVDDQVIIQPHEIKLVQTGIAIALPAGYEAQIRARSGLSLKNGITIANGIGTIDSDYRGEIGVILINQSEQPYIVEHGARIAQLVIARYEKAEWEEAAELEITTRGKGGYGSTGN